MVDKTQCKHETLFTNDQKHNEGKMKICPKCSLLFINKDGRILVKGISPSARNLRKSEINAEDSVKIMIGYISKFHENEGPQNKRSNFLVLRKKVIIQLKELSKKFNFSEDIFYTSLEYTDRLLAPIEKVNLFTSMKLELLVIGCFLLAVKFNGTDPIVPEFSEFSSYDVKHYDIEEVIKTEIACLTFLDYKLDIFTSFHILTIFFNHGIVFDDEINPLLDSYKVFSFATKALNLFVCNNLSINYNPMQIALAIVFNTRQHFKLSKEKTEMIVKFYGYDLNYFKVCLNAVHGEDKSNSFLEFKEKSQTCRSLANVSQEKLRFNIYNNSDSKLGFNSKKLIPTVCKINYVDIAKKEQICAFNRQIKHEKKESIENEYNLLTEIKKNFSKQNSITSSASTSTNVSSKSVAKYSGISRSNRKMSNYKLPEIKINYNFKNTQINTNSKNNSSKMTKTSNSLFKFMSSFKAGTTDPIRFENVINCNY